jgi:hypothetical protein
VTESFIIHSGNIELIRIAVHRVLSDYAVDSINLDPISVPHHYSRTRVTVLFSDAECHLAYRIRWDDASIATHTQSVMYRMVSQKYNLD